MSAARHVVIVGAGHAGGRVAQHLRALGYRDRLTLIGEETHAPYERPALSKELLLGEKRGDELVLGPASFWDDASTVERVHARVTGVDKQARRLALDDGTSLGFDELVIASGGAPRMLDVPGAMLPGVIGLRTLDDGLALAEALRSVKRIAIVGAGVIGMEVASSARALGIEVTVLEAGERILARSLPPALCAWLRERHESQGVRIETGVQVRAIASNEGECGYIVQAMREDGTTFALPAQRVLVAVGIECAVGFLDGTGLASREGVSVDERCRSPLAPWCYAAGDVAQAWHALYGKPVRLETWRNAENQAAAVAGFIMGRNEPYMEIPWMWTDQAGHNVQVVGLPSRDDEVCVRATRNGHPSTVLLLREGCVTGGVLIDNGRERRHLEALVARRAKPAPERLGDASIPLKELAQ
ncbi:FAD-dependent oxidoreductase [Paraburkholderia sp. A2WS-5]|uniref:NAD(P)/FAD-dependent oxidoreductase n=1 Tax=unclassified Paraburkholderia TaxID=2615204 RepID=UPI003B7A89B4